MAFCFGKRGDMVGPNLTMVGEEKKMTALRRSEPGPQQQQHTREAAGGEWRGPHRSYLLWRLCPVVRQRRFRLFK